MGNSTSETEEGDTLFQEIHALFHPRSVAVVGVPTGLKMGRLFLMALLDQGFPGPLYPVHPEAKEIDGLRAYPSVSAIPGELDLAIVLVPQHLTLPVVRECAGRGVKGAILFTAGYKEMQTAEGASMEKELVRIARASGMRLIGPNCMGLYVPKAGLSFFPQLARKPGPVGIISHSGSLASTLCRMGPERGLYFSKAVSLGNECDLTAADFLHYLGRDPDTGVIGIYLEGIREGGRFLAALREASIVKPVILWKVGLTEEGCLAAASHTGAMGGSRTIWESVVRQGGAVAVTGFEEWVDTLTGFALLPAGVGERIGVISGPGGIAVSAAEACGKEGLTLAALSPDTVDCLASFLPPTGTSPRNPVDVGLSSSLIIDYYIRAAEAVAADPGVDTVLICGIGATPEINQTYADAMIRIRRESGKPFLILNFYGLDPAIPRQLQNAGIPVFESAERALATCARVIRYRRWRRAHS